MAQATEPGRKATKRPDADPAEQARHLAAVVELAGSSFRLTLKMGRGGKVLAPMALALLVGACQHDRYSDRRDEITFGTGDAVAANKAMHIIDPWPRASRTVEHGMSGEQAEAAMKKLRRRADENPDQQQQQPTLTLTPVAPPKL
jgi:hypothetical protein